MNDPERSGLRGIGTVAAVVAAVLVAFLALPMLLGVGRLAVDGGGGGGGGGDDADRGHDAAPETSDEPMEVDAIEHVGDGDDALGLHGPPAIVGRSVRIHGPLALAPSLALDQATDGELVDVEFSGFLANQSGVIAQCVGGAGGGRCFDLFPIVTDGNGAGRTAFRLDRPSECAAGRPCSLVVDIDYDRGSARIVYDAIAVPSRRVSASAIDGRTRAVRVDVFDATSPDRLRVEACPADAVNLDDCKTLAGRPVTSGDGAFFEVRVGRGDATLVVVDSREGVIDVPAPVSLPRVSGASYSPGRLGAGVAIAALLVALAAWLVRSTDWRPPAEAGTPAMDRAVLVDSLDG